MACPQGAQSERGRHCPQGAQSEAETWPIFRKQSLSGEPQSVLRESRLRTQHEGLDILCMHSTGTWSPLLGLSNLKSVVRQIRSKETLADQLCPSPSKQPWRRGPGAPACGPERAASAQGHRRRAGWGGRSVDRLSLSRCSSPGSTLQLHLFRVTCLTEHPKQFQDYISLSHLFARGVSQARKWVALLLFALP